MTAAVLTLSDFLLARIAEDEAAAKAAIAHPVPADADAVFVKWSRQDTGWVPSAGGEWTEGSALFARWDPARVLAECEAKRRIVEQYVEARDSNRAGGMQDYGYEEGLEQALTILALPYADHPDYREEWKP